MTTTTDKMEEIARFVIWLRKMPQLADDKQTTIKLNDTQLIYDVARTKQMAIKLSDTELIYALSEFCGTSFEDAQKAVNKVLDELRNKK